MNLKLLTYASYTYPILSKRAISVVKTNWYVVPYTKAASMTALCSEEERKKLGERRSYSIQNTFVHPFMLYYV